MFVRVYPVITGNNDFYTLSSNHQIINTDQIISIKCICDQPKTRMVIHQTRIEKIFDTKFENLRIYRIVFSNNTIQDVIGPKSNYEHIK